MDRRIAIGLCFGIPVVSLIIGAQINAAYSDRRQAIETLNRSDADNWERERRERQAAFERERAVRRAKHGQDLESAWGGAVEAAWKNPEYDLQQMLAATAKACAPPGTTAKVRVDRFTEFELFLNVPAGVDPGLPTMLLGLFRHCAPLFSSVRIAQAGNLIAELDERVIDEIPDWSAATAPQVQQLLDANRSTDFADTSARENPASSGDKSDSLALVPGLAEAQSAFQGESAEQSRQIDGILAAQTSAVQLNDVTSSGDLEAKLSRLHDNEKALTAAEDFFLNQDREFQQQLERNSVDSLQTRIYARASTQRQQARRPYVEKAFRAIYERQRNALGLVTIMQQSYGSWQMDPGSAAVRFTRNEVRLSYQDAGGKFKLSTDEVKSALAEWTQWEREQRNESH